MKSETQAIRTPLIRLLLIAGLAGFMYQPVAYGDMISTDQLVHQERTDSKKAELVNLLAREEVQARMTDLGVDLVDAQNRVESMTKAELDQLFSSLDALPAGGGVAGTVLTVLLIILILDIAGVTDIYPGI